MEQLIITFVEKLMEQTVKAVDAENALELLKTQMAGITEELNTAAEKFKKVQEELDTTNGAWAYKTKLCAELMDENNALKQEVARLKAQLSEETEAENNA